MTTSTPPLRILLVTTVPCAADGLRRLDLLRIGLRQGGCEIVGTAPADGALCERVAQLQPDLIVADAPADACALAAQIGRATLETRRPVVLFTEDQRPASMEAALAAGVTSYVVEGLQAARIGPVVQVALARFRQQQKLLEELDAARHKLAERKLIDRAKGLLMDRGRLSEDQAYQKLRTMAMNKNMKLGELAQRILDVEDLLG